MKLNLFMICFWSLKKNLERFSILFTYSYSFFGLGSHKNAYRKVVHIVLANFYSKLPIKLYISRNIRNSQKDGVKKSEKVSEMHFPAIWTPKKTVKILNLWGKTDVDKNAWIKPCLDMSEYAGICLNMPKSAWMAFVLHFAISPFVLQSLLYLNTWLLIWTSTGDLRLYKFLQVRFKFAVTFRDRGVWARKSWYTLLVLCFLLVIPYL